MNKALVFYLELILNAYTPLVYAMDDYIHNNMSEQRVVVIPNLFLDTKLVSSFLTTVDVLHFVTPILCNITDLSF